MSAQITKLSNHKLVNTDEKKKKDSDKKKQRVYSSKKKELIDNKRKSIKKSKTIQKGGSNNIEPTLSLTDSLKFGDSIDNQLNLYQLNGFPGKPPSPDCVIM
jgi:hypothetical protein